MCFFVLICMMHCFWVFMLAYVCECMCFSRHQKSILILIIAKYASGNVSLIEVIRRGGVLTCTVL
jgi:hypothetical protein